jgi:hypothetical protein
MIYDIPFILIFLSFLVAYSIDLATVLYFKKKKPILFNASESNVFLKNSVDRFGTKLGIIIYSFTYQLQIMIITFLALTIPLMVFFEFKFLDSITLGFMYFIFLHLIGSLTNIIALCFKKEIKGIKQDKRAPSYLG